MLKLQWLQMIYLLNEQRIEDLEKQPAFILDIEADEDKMKYVIKNVGGDIKYGNVFGV